MTRLFRYSLVLVFFSFSTLSLSALDYVWTGAIDNNWANQANWRLEPTDGTDGNDGYPDDNSDTASFETAFAIATSLGGPQTIGELSISSGTAAVTVDNTLTIDDAGGESGSLIMSTGTLTISGSNQVRIDGAWNNTGASVNINTSEVRFTGAAATITSNLVPFYDLSITSGNATPQDALEIERHFAISGGAGYTNNGQTLTLSTNASNLTDSNGGTQNLGAVTVSDATVTMQTDILMNSLSIGSQLTAGANNLDINGNLSGLGTYSASSATTSVDGDFTVTTFTHNNGTVDFTAVGAINDPGAGYTFRNLTVSGGTRTMNEAVTVTGNVLISAGTLDANGANDLTVSGNLTGAGTYSASSSTTTLGGNLTVTTYTHNNGLLSVNGACALTSGVNTFYDLTVAAGGTVTPQDALEVERHFTIDNTGTYTNNGQTLTLSTNASDLTDSNGGTQNLGAVTVSDATVTMQTDILMSSLSISSQLTAGANNLTVTGNLTGLGTYSASSATTTLGGNLSVTTYTHNNGLLTVDGACALTSGANTFYDLTIAAGGTVTPQDALEVERHLTIDNTGTYTNNGQTLILSTNASNLTDSNGGTQNLGAVTVSDATVTMQTDILMSSLSIGSQLTAGANNLTVTGNLTGLGTYSASSATTTLGGDLSVTTYTHNNGLLSVNGACALTSGVNTLYDLTVAAGGTVTPQDALEVERHFTIDNTGTYANNGQTLTLSTNASDLTDSNGGTQNLGAVTVSDATVTMQTDILMSSLSIGSQLTAGANNLDINGNLSGLGTYSASSGTTSVDGDFTVTTFTHNNGTVDFTAVGAINDPGAGYTFRNLTVSGGTRTMNEAVTVTGNVLISAGTLDANGANDLTVSGNLTGAGTYSASSSTTTLGGNLTVTTYTHNNGLLSVNGACALTSGVNTFYDLTVAAGGTVTPQDALEVERHLTIDNTGTYANNGQTLTLSTNASDLTDSNGGTQNLGAVTISDATVTMQTDILMSSLSIGSQLTAGANNLDINGNLSGLGTYSASSATTTLGGNLTVSTFTHNNGLLTVDGACALTSGVNTLYDLTVAAGGTVTPQDALEVERHFTIDNTGTYANNGQTLTLSTNASDLTDSNGGTQNLGAVTVSDATVTMQTDILMSSLSIGSQLTAGANNLDINGNLSGLGTYSASSGTTSVDGDFTVTTFTHNNGTVDFTAVGAINDPGAGYTFRNLTVSGGTRTMNEAVTVTGNVLISAGTLDANGANDLTVSGNLTGAGTYSASSSTTTLGGNLTVTTYTHNNGLLSVNGACALTSGVNTFYDLTVAAGGTVTPQDALEVERHFTIDNTGTYTNNGQTLTLSTNASDLTDSNGGTQNLGAVTVSDATVTMQTDILMSSLSIGSQLTAGANNLTVTGNLTGLGTYSASSATTTLGGNLSVTTYTHNNGLLTVDGACALTSGANTFYDLTIAAGGTVTPQDALEVERHFTIDNTGTYTNNGQTLILSTNASNLTDSNGGTQNLGAVTVSDATVTMQTDILMSSLSIGSQLTAGANNLTVTGNLTGLGTYSASSATTTLGGDLSVTTYTHNNGLLSVNGACALTSGVNTFYDLTVAAGGTVTPQDALEVERHLTIDNTGTYTNNGQTLTLSTNASDLTDSNGGTQNLGAVTVSDATVTMQTDILMSSLSIGSQLTAGANNLTVTGNLTGLGTYSASSATTTLGGNLSVTTYTHNNGLLSVNGACALTSGVNTFYDLTVAAGGTVTPQDALEVERHFTIDNTGTYTNNGQTLTLSTNASDLTDSNGGTQNLGAVTVSDATVTMQTDILMSSLSIGSQLTAGANNLDINGNLSGLGTYSASSGTTSVDGDFTVTTFTHNNGTVDFTAVGAINDPGAGYTFRNLTVSGGTRTMNEAVTVTGNVLISAGTLDANGANDLTVSGNLTGAGTYSASSSTTTLGGNLTVTTYTHNNGLLSVNGACALTSGVNTFYDLTVAAGGTVTPQDALEVERHFTIDNTGTYTNNGQTLTLSTNASDLTDSNGGTQNLGAVTVSDATVTMQTDILMTSLSIGSQLTAGANNLDINGNLSGLGTYSASSATTTLGGNLSVTTYTHNNGLLSVNGVCALTSGVNTFYDLTVAAGGTVTPQDALEVERHFTIDNTGTYTNNGQTLTLSTSAGNLTDSNGGTQNLGAVTVSDATVTMQTDILMTSLSIGSQLTAGANNLDINGNLSGLGTYSASSATTTLGGNLTVSTYTHNNGLLTVDGACALTSGTNTFYDLTIAAGGTVTPQDALEVERHFTIDAGGSYTNNGQTLTLSTNASDLTDSNGGTQDLGSVTISDATVTLGSDIQMSSIVSTASIAGGTNSLTVNLTANLGASVTGLDTFYVGTTTVVNTTTITSTGTQTYDDAVTLGANATFTGSTITFNGTVGGGGTRSIDIVGDAVFGNAAIDQVTNITSLTVSGLSTINTDTISSSGAQSYTGNVTLGTDTVLTGTTVTFQNSIVGGGSDLSITGNAVFGDVAGDTAGGLGNLSVSGTSNISMGSINSGANTQDYSQTVTLSNNTNLTASTATFLGTVVGGANGLTVTGNAIFGNAAIDTVTGLSTLNVTGTTDSYTSITSTGTQTYGSAVNICNTVGTNMQTTTGGDIIFSSTVNSSGGTFPFTVVADNNLTISGIVGGVTALSSMTATATSGDIILTGIGNGAAGVSGTVTVNSSDQLTLSGGDYISGDDQTYNTGANGTLCNFSADGDMRVTGGTPLITFDELYLDFNTIWTVRLYTRVSCSKFVFYGGTLNLGGQILDTTNGAGGDFVVFGSNYDEDDADWTGVDTRFEYHDMAGLLHVPGGFDAAFADNIPVSANIETGSRITVGAGRNFYVNGADLDADGNWFLDVNATSGSNVLYNDGLGVSSWGTPYNMAFNLDVSNCQASGGNISAAEPVVASAETNNNVGDNGGNIEYVPATTVGWDFDRPDISTVETVWDDAIYITFTEPIENSNDQISDLIGNNILLTNGNTVDITDTFMGINNDGTSTGNSTDGDGDLTSFYIRFGTTWNTDAELVSTGGGASSTDASGINRAVVPDLAMIKAALYDAGGHNPVRNYGNNGFGAFQTVSDGCGPVIIDVTTGQYGTTGNEYDNHNYMTLTYSEPVKYMEDDGTTAIAGAGIGNTITNDISENYSFNGSGYLGQIPDVTGANVNVTVTGLMTYDGNVVAGGSATEGFVSGSIPGATYSNSNNTLDKPASGYSLTINIVSYSPDGGTTWEGYLGQAGMDLIQPANYAGLASDNVQDANNNSQKITTNPITQVGGGWDVDPPGIAEYTISGAREIIPLDNSGGDSILDRFEFHLHDDFYTFDGVWDTDTDHPDGNGGGMRDSSLQNNTDAFYFGIQGTSLVNTYNDATLNTEVVNSTYNKAGAIADDQYFSILMTGAPWDTLSRMETQYDEDVGYMTDLAGNRLRDFQVLCVEYIPPEIDLALCVPGNDWIYVRFSEPVFGNLIGGSIDAGDLYYSGGSLSITNVTQYSGGITNQEFLLQLDGELIRNDIFTGKIYVNPTSIYDADGNAYRDSIVRQISDLGFDVVEPIWASDGIHDESIREGSTLTDFDGTGRLLDRNITLQARINASVVADSSMRMYYDVDVPGSKVVDELWLPSYHPILSPLGNFSARYLNSSESLGNGLQNFVLPASDEEVEDGNTIEFIFMVDGLPCVRMATEGDIWSYEPWSFDIDDIRKQRGGVTILNNVINPKDGDKAVLMYEIPSSGVVTAQIFSLNGSLVKILHRGRQAKGSYQYTWDGRNHGGRIVARGIYFVRVVGPDTDEIRKIMVVK